MHEATTKLSLPMTLLYSHRDEVESKRKRGDIFVKSYDGSQVEELYYKIAICNFFLIAQSLGLKVAHLNTNIL